MTTPCVQHLYDSIVLSGGGVKGLFQLGVLWYATNAGLLNMDEVKIFAGTSIGATICTMLVLGATPFEIFIEMYSRDIFIDDSSIQKFKDLKTQWGAISIRKVFSFVRELITNKLKLRKDETLTVDTLTFENLYTLTGKDLLITSVNVSKTQLEIFSHTTTPKLRVFDALCMSANLPVVCTKIRYKGDLYTDGGLLDNVPIACVLPRTPRRVFVISTSGIDPTAKIISFFDYVYRIQWLPVNTRTITTIADAPTNVHVIHLVTDAPILSMTLKPDEKMKMFEHGHEEARRFFSEFRTFSFE